MHVAGRCRRSRRFVRSAGRGWGDGDEYDVADGEASPPAQQFKAAGSRGSGQQPPEEELWSGTYSPQAMAGPAAGLAVLTVIGLIVAVIAAGIGFIIWVIGAIVCWGLLGLVLLYRRTTVRTIG